MDVFARPKHVFLTTAALLVALIDPRRDCARSMGELKFEANPRSLEPADSHAGNALRMITEKMPAIGEPWIVLVHATGCQQDLHDRWDRLQSAWAKLVTDGQAS